MIKRSVRKKTFEKTSVLVTERKNNSFLPFLVRFFFVLGFLSLGLFLLLSINSFRETRHKKAEGKVEISNLVYTSDQDWQRYYSVGLDTLFEYNAQKFSLSDTLDQVSIIKKGETNFFLNSGGTIDLLQESDLGGKQLSQYFLDRYLKNYQDVQVIDEGEGEGLSWFTIILTGEYKLKEKGSISFKKHFIAKKVGDTYLYVSYQNKTEITDDLKKIISTAKLHPQGLEEMIDVEARKAGVKVRADRLQWSVEGPNDFYFTLSRKEKEARTYTRFRVEYEKPVNAISLKDESLLKLAQDDLAQWLKAEVSTEQRKTTKQPEEITLKDNTLVKYEASYMIRGAQVTDKLTRETQKLGDRRVLLKKYFIYNPHTGYLIRISLTNTQGEKEGMPAAEEILNTLELTGIGTEQTAIGKKSNILGTSSVQVDKAAVIGASSVVHIFNRSCTSFTVPMDQLLPLSSGNSYKLCGGAFGTGFFVDKSGYVITNAHVASPNPVDTAFVPLLYSQEGETVPFWSDFFEEVLSAMISTNQIDVSSGYLTQDQAEYVNLVMAKFFIEMIDKQMITLNFKPENYLENGQPFEIDSYDLSVINKDVYLGTQLVDANLIASENRQLIEYVETGKYPETSEPDLALLKVDQANEYPVLSLADEKSLVVGQAINAIGFPDMADNKMLFSKEASVLPTLTKGTVSAIKPNSNNTFRLVQIDAAIAGGNSGGPIVNQESEVIGVSTYGLVGRENESANMNVGVAVDSIKEILSRNRVTPQVSKTATLIKSGADHYVLNYFKWAVRDWKAAITFYPSSSPVLTPMVAAAEIKIGSKEDKTPLFMVGNWAVTKLHVGLLFGGLLFIIVGSFLIVVFIRKKKEGQGPTINLPVQPIPSFPQGQTNQTLTPSPSSSSPLPPSGINSPSDSGQRYPSQPS